MIKRIILLFIGFIGINSITWAKAQDIEVRISVFSTQAYSIKNAQLAQHIYQLDKVEIWEKHFSQTLNASPIQAEHQAKTIFQRSDIQTKIHELQQAYQNIVTGWQTGIRKVPAVLFESHHGQSVVYGVDDVQYAMMLWQEWIHQKENRK